jgi:aspartyl-tRNA(Asn)/glutamyl-tRNA(Gln) amidotransferase subunit B
MDAGKSIHDQRDDETLIDLNRSGVALMEIVSEPDIRSPDEAAAYMRKLRSILRYLGTCDGNMEEGSLRCDANVSVRKVGDPNLNTRCEVKNVNSIRFVAKAIEYEARRQVELIEGGGRVVQETRLFDSARGETRSMRGKEEAHDYRYFPDPDLLPLELDEALIERARAPCRSSPTRRRPASSRPTGSRPTTPRCWSPRRARPPTSRPRPRAATRSRPRTGSSTTCSACSPRPAATWTTAPSAPRRWVGSSTC